MSTNANMMRIWPCSLKSYNNVGNAEQKKQQAAPFLGSGG